MKTCKIIKPHSQMKTICLGHLSDTLLWSFYVMHWFVILYIRFSTDLKSFAHIVKKRAQKKNKCLFCRLDTLRDISLCVFIYTLQFFFSVLVFKEAMKQSPQGCQLSHIQHETPAVDTCLMLSYHTSIFSHSQKHPELKL